MQYNTNTQTVGWFRDRHREGTLTLRPPYQRKPVWGDRQKSFLIESVLLAYPIPEIFVQQSTTPEGLTTYAVVDGQQRIRTLLQFVGADRDPDEQGANYFSLDKVTPQSEWYSKKFSDLSEDSRRAYYGYQLSVRHVITDDESEVREIFKRMNKNVSPLSPQELRNATFVGPFLKMSMELADREYWAQNAIVTPASIRRMGDVEFVSDLLIGVLHGPQSGGPGSIDEYYARYEDFDDEFPGQKHARSLFESTLTRIQTLFPEIRKTRWSNKADFYSLFVALAYLLDTRKPVGRGFKAMREALDRFSLDVARFRGEEVPTGSGPALNYLRALQRGANDKNRRADRHSSLLRVLEPFFATSE